MSMIAALLRHGSPPLSKRPHFLAIVSINSLAVSHLPSSLSSLYWPARCSRRTVAMMASMKVSGSSSRSARTTPFRTESVSVSPAVSTTTPGQSMRDIRLKSVTYCQILVSPGMGATLQLFLEMRVLMTLDFPTLGYPTTPTLICFLSSWSFPNCRNMLIKAPLPKACVNDAWNAIVGLSFANSPIHRLATQLGTRSTLLSTKIKCL
mmetsp:Transcript_8104/g.23309  ORF Transcript_8104/g.23309 Transcript_8104/m.23309 type:complete len:207 (-) Transcript_8104:219-839(-)